MSTIISFAAALFLWVALSGVVAFLIGEWRTHRDPYLMGWALAMWLLLTAVTSFAAHRRWDIIYTHRVACAVVLCWAGASVVLMWANKRWGDILERHRVIAGR